LETSAAYWWKSDKSTMSKDVFAYVNWLNQDQNYRQVDNFKNMRLYGQNDLLTSRLYPYARTELNNTSIQNRVTLNVIQSMIDTVTSKITKNKPKPTFLTDGGNFKEQRRARRLTQFAEGQFQATDFYAKAAIAFQDSCIFGTGALKIFKDGRDIKVERVFIDELAIDDREALYGKPRQMHQHKWVHKDVLKAMFPKFEQAIDVQASTNSNTMGGTSSTLYNSEMIKVIESWRLPSKKGKKDGKHAICIENQTLLEESYSKDYFPFVFWRWGVRPLGFFGQGLAEQLTGLQIEINKILRTIQISMHLVSIPKIFVEANSKVVTAHLNNQIGGIIKWSGTKPEEGKLGSVPVELFTHLDRLYARAFEIAGVSQLSATSQKPAGLDSGKAMRTYNDLETERFMSVAQRYEQAFLDATKIMIDLAKEIDEEEGGYSVQAKDGNFLRTIKWKDVNLEEDTYIMQMFPTSALATNFSGRMADVQDLIALGAVGKEDTLRLLDLPDLQSFYNLSNAPAEDIHRVIERFVDTGEYETPEPFQDLAYGMTKIQSALLYFKAQGADEETLELFRRWLSDADSLLKKATTEAARQTFEAQAATTTGAEHTAILEGEPMELQTQESDVPEVDPNMPPPVVQ
jgi:hypothetical protein